MDTVSGDTHMTSTLRRDGVKGKSEMLSGVGEKGVSECSGRPVFIFFIKGSWICAMIRHHAEPNINILLTRNLPFNSDVKQSRHPLLMSLHFLWAKSSI